MSPLDIALEVIRIPLQWFSYLLEKSGMTGLYIGLILIAIVFRFLLAPIFGRSLNMGSDFAKQTGSDDGHVLDSTGYDAMWFDEDGEMWG